MNEVKNLTATEAAERLRVSPDTMARYRWKGTGPAYIKSGGRVLYPENLLAEWERSNTRSSTREAR